MLHNKDQQHSHRHKHPVRGSTGVVDEATFVLKSRGRLGHICDNDTSLVWCVGSQAVRLRREQCSTQLCNPTGDTHILVMLMDGRVLMIENCKTGEGLELWRKLAEANELKAGTRAAGHLVKVLNVEFGMGDFLNSLEKWENLINQHDGRSPRW